jgi:hypothetical protein
VPTGPTATPLNKGHTFCANYFRHVHCIRTCENTKKLNYLIELVGISIKSVSYSWILYLSVTNFDINFAIYI